MKKKTVKNKVLYSLIAVTVMIIVLGLWISIGYVNGQSQVFNKGGYVIVANEQAESEVYSFPSQTKYSKNITGGFQFDDVQNNPVEINEDNFIYFEDNTYSSLTKGVVLNLTDIERTQSVNHYGVSPAMTISKSSKGYQIINNDKPVELDEVLWKLNEKKYLLLADSMDVVFGDKDIRKVNQFLEINFIDEGVIQLVTQDNVWQTVSADAYIKTEKGVEINLLSQLITYKKQQMLMGKLVVDTDENVILSPLETKKQVVPEFEIDDTNGDDGEGGESGDNGTKGEQGVNGNNGTNGTEGTNGTSGGDGNKGGSGNKGQSGNAGIAGTTPGTESASKTKIPQISIVNWKVDATGLSGEYAVEDENTMLNDYLSIIVYEANSGKKIMCVDDNGQSDSFDYFEKGKFKIDSTLTPLTPDTEYRLIISGSYEMAGLNFEREFVSRVFYTDSLGVFMNKGFVSTDSIQVNISRNDYSSATTAEVYLLSIEQAKTFDPSQTSNSYIKETVDFSSGNEKVVKFDANKHNVKSNTNYIVRMVINTVDKKYMTQQVLDLFSLKKAPKLSGQPYAINNRQLGAFELFGGQVIDDDNAIIGYTFDIIDTKLNTVVKSMDIKPTAVNEATILYIDNKAVLYETDYVFKVLTMYNDNEKVIELESVISPQFRMSKANLPAVNLRVEENQYNKITGQLIISLNGSKITATENSPLDIAIECEGVFSKTLSFKSLKNNPDILVTESQIIISINESHLSAGKIYRMTVSGQVDLGDENSRRVIGNIVQTTPNLTELKAVWGIDQGSGNAISRTLKFEATNDPTWDKDSYDAGTLSKVIVELYRGSGSGKVYMASKEFIDTIEDPYQSSLVDDFITNGIEINEGTFGYTSASLTAQTYTLKASAVYDYTATVNSSDNINSGNFSKYKNEYPVLESTKEELVSKSTQPPTLPDINVMDNQLISEPIYNKDAGVYNQSVNKELADDTVVGYKLKANYDNYAKLARQVSYYVFENKKFDKMVAAKDNPIYNHTDQEIIDKDNAQWLVKRDIDISASTLNIPSMAIFFENKNQNNDYIYNGVYVSFGGEVLTETDADGNQEIKEGMSRGYKYSFAYTVKYNPSGLGEGTMIYPYNHPSYENLYNTPSTTKSYVLSSGSISCPKTNPSFLAFPWKNQKGATMEVRYQYVDVDNTIPKNASVLVNLGGSYSPTGEQLANVQNVWNTLNFPQLPGSSGDVLEPRVTRNLYAMDYGENNYMSMFKIALDNEGTFNSGMVNELTYSVDQSKLANNIINIRLYNKGSSNQNYLDAYNNRITSLQVNIISEDDKNLKETYIIPYDQQLKGAKLSTARLSKFFKHRIKIEVHLIFDNGNIGWAYPTANKQFAMQRVNILSNKVTLGKYDSYNQEGNSLILSSTAGGSHFTPSLNENGDFKFIDENLSSDYVEYRVRFTGVDRFKGMRVKPTNYGLSRAIENDESYLEIYTPKEVSTIPIKDCVDNSNSFELGIIAPSVSTNSYISTLDSATIHNVYFSGKEVIDVSEAGERIVELKITDSKGVVKKERIDVSNWKDNSQLVIKDLKKEEVYTVTMHAKVNNVEVTLLNTNTFDGGIWSMSINMKKDVKITKLSANYKALAYNNKQVSVNYYLDQYSGFFIEMEIYDDTGKLIYNAEDLKNNNLFSGYTPGQSYQYEMQASINIPIDDKKLTYGRSYILKIVAKGLMSDGTVGADIVGISQTSFTLPKANDPIPFVNMVSVYDEDSKKINLELGYSLGDLDQIIMSDYKNDSTKATYLVRLYKVNADGKMEDVTPENIDKNIHSVGQNYNFELKNVEADTRYVFKVYAALDLDSNGIEDRTNIETSIDTLDKDQLDKIISDLEIWEESCTTPGENGIGFGEVGLESTDNDPTRISFSYKNASNLNSIAAIDYSIISSSGDIRLSGTIDNKDKSKFILKSTNGNSIPGYFLLNLPEVLETKGVYRVIVNYYLLDSNGKLVLMNQKHSSQYVFDR